MALISTIIRADKDATQVHGPTECRYSIFRTGNKTYLQLDTYGSATRQHPEKISQAIQLDRKAAKKLKELIEQAFPDLK